MATGTPGVPPGSDPNAVFPWQPGGPKWWFDTSTPPPPGSPADPNPLPQIPPPIPPDPSELPSNFAFEPAYGYMQANLQAGMDPIRNAMSLRGITGPQAFQAEMNYRRNLTGSNLQNLQNLAQGKATTALAESGLTGFLGGQPTSQQLQWLNNLALQQGQLTGIYSSPMQVPGGYTQQQVQYQQAQQQGQQNTQQWIQYLFGLLPFLL